MLNHPSADLSPEQELDRARAADHELIRPPLEFQGRELWPYTPGSKLLYHQALDEEDVTYLRPLVFVFIHLRRGAQTRQADLLVPREEFGGWSLMRLCWNLERLHAAVMEWLDTLPEGAVEEAGRVLSDALAPAAATEIRATSADAGAQKKMVSRLPKPITSLPSSAKPSGSRATNSSGKRPSGK